MGGKRKRALAFHRPDDIKVYESVNIPRSGRKPKWPWESLRVNQCFEIPATVKARRNITGSIYYWSQKLGRRYTVRTEFAQDGTARVFVYRSV